MVLGETVGFVFLRVLMRVLGFQDEVEGNIRTQGKTKLTSFLREHTLGALLYM